MSEKYDCTEDVRLHQWAVKHYMKIAYFDLLNRIDEHDASKLQEPEKSMFDQFTPRLKEVAFGSDEYNAALREMGEALKHHYANNRHHPEHFENGVNGMNLIDLLEMVCDWRAASDLKGQMVDLNHLANRFGLSGQLMGIILNTLEMLNN